MIGIDDSILYLANEPSSPLYQASIDLLEKLRRETGVAVTDSCVLKCAKSLIDKRAGEGLVAHPEVGDTLAGLLDLQGLFIISSNLSCLSQLAKQLRQSTVSRDSLDRVHAACILAEHGISKLLTVKVEYYQDCNFLPVINPFSSDPLLLAQTLKRENGFKRFIPYSRHWIDGADIASVCHTLCSDWLTTGPKVEEFEESIAKYVDAKYAVAVSSGTAALHAAMYALSIGPGDEVILPAMTFVASANSVVFQGGTPVFADVDPDTLLVDPKDIETKITSRTKAILAVDYAGQPCDYDQLVSIAKRNGLHLVADACHALGAKYKMRSVGTLADLTVFSFHPVKHIAAGEGGMITTGNVELAHKMRVFRNHGITTDHRQRHKLSSWYYEMIDLGYNYRITDIQCALGISQLRKLSRWNSRRLEVAALYDEAFRYKPQIRPLRKRPEISHAYHLYVVRLDQSKTGRTRQELFQLLRARGIGVNVHYIPVHLHPFYRERYGTRAGLCPIAEKAYEEIISLPMYPAMEDHDVQLVIEAVSELASIP